jgi:hypothetical protein
MVWVKFDVETCPKGTSLIFLDLPNQDWFVGELNLDSEYGYCIDLFETVVGVEGITHYLKPDILAAYYIK